MVGGGCGAFAAVRDALGEIGYSAGSSIEPDIDPSGAAEPLADAIDSRRFLERCGIATPSS
jgi:sugar phosphate isomerase/epimerase